MKLIPITSHNNALVKQARKLHDRSFREKSGLFLLEGAKILNEALAKDIELKAIFVSETFLKEGLSNVDQNSLSDTPLNIVEDKLLLEMGTTTTSCGILAIGSVKKTTLEKATIGQNPLIVIGDQIQDPGNLGTLVRTSLAFGASSLVLTKGSVDPYNPKVVRSAMGALFSLPIATDISEEELVLHLKEKKIPLVAFAANASETFHSIDFSGPCALAFGNEGHGLTDFLTNESDHLVSIPIADTTESLNVSIAAGIVLCHSMEVRKKGNSKGITTK